MPFEVIVLDPICEKMRLLEYEDINNMQIVIGNSIEADDKVTQPMPQKLDGISTLMCWRKSSLTSHSEI